MSLVQDLVAVIGVDRVKHHPLELRLFEKDAGVTRGEVAAVVLPETTAEVAATVKTAKSWGVPVVARGAGTGLAGGAVPTRRDAPPGSAFSRCSLWPCSSPGPAGRLPMR